MTAGGRPPQESRLAFLFEQIALTLDWQGVAVAQQPVENGGGQDVIAEDGAPLGDELIGRDEQTAAGARVFEKYVRPARP